MKTISKAYGTAVYAESIEDIIFEGRNQKYGAYFLRSHYKNHLLFSLLGVILFAILAVGIPHLKSIFFPKEIVQTVVPPFTCGLTIITIDDPLPTVLPKVPDVFQQLSQSSSIGAPVVVDDASNVTQTFTMSGYSPDEPNDVAPGTLIIIGRDGGTGEIDDHDKTYEPFEVTEQAIFRVKPYKDFSEWLKKNLEFPADAVSADVSGKVVLEFTVDEEGNICNVHVIKSLHPVLDKAAIEAVQKSPKWKPAKHNGTKVKEFFRVPVYFKVEKL